MTTVRKMTYNIDMEKTIFQKIIDREIPAGIVYEDDICICIIDKFPSTKGQTLIISKEVVENVFDLPEETYNHMMKVAKKIEKATREALNPFRVCLVVEGFEVPHAHIKLFPVTEAKLDTSGGPELSNEEVEELVNKIKEKLD
jgi:histidine triad (HIT) family protein